MKDPRGCVIICIYIYYSNFFVNVLYMDTWMDSKLRLLRADGQTTSRWVISGSLSTKEIPACEIIQLQCQHKDKAMKQTEAVKCSTGNAKAMEWNGMEWNEMECKERKGTQWNGMVCNKYDAHLQVDRKERSTIINAERHLVYSFLPWCALQKRGKGHYTHLRT